MKILVINGPNINMLGIREPEIYGREDYNSLCETVRLHAEKCGVGVEIYQSNHEGDLIDKIQSAYGVFDGIVINPAGYTHTSVALLDALKAVAIPAVEVHISDITEREPFRSASYVRSACLATVIGRGIKGYCDAMDILIAKKGGR
ncbi:MAG: type II 3-dehydroquinate dehydratase [Clostridia bacterium]|nr:type II 3-dehydroquinate dehydratase [Clostridia bacterium]